MRAWLLAGLLVARVATAATFLSEIQSGLPWVVAPVVTADGQFVYSSDTVFSREPTLGLLTPVSSFSSLSGTDEVALGSADEGFLYLSGGSGIGVYARDSMTGLVTQVQVVAGSPIFPFRDP